MIMSQQQLKWLNDAFSRSVDSLQDIYLLRTIARYMVQKKATALANNTRYCNQNNIIEDLFWKRGLKGHIVMIRADRAWNRCRSLR